MYYPRCFKTPPHTYTHTTAYTPLLLFPRLLLFHFFVIIGPYSWGFTKV